MVLQFTASPATIAMYSAMFEIFSRPTFHAAACSVYRRVADEPDDERNQDEEQ